jgi:hypothetical protein
MLSVEKRLAALESKVFKNKMDADEINLHNGKRGEYRCKKCGIYKWM